MTNITPILRRNANTAKLVAEIGSITYSEALGGRTNVIVDGIAFEVTTIGATMGACEYNVSVKDALTARFNHIGDTDLYIATFTDGPKDLTNHLAAIHDTMDQTAFASAEGCAFLVWDTPVAKAGFNVKRAAKIAALSVAVGAVSIGAGIVAYKWFKK